MGLFDKLFTVEGSEKAKTDPLDVDAPVSKFSKGTAPSMPLTMPIALTGQVDPQIVAQLETAVASKTPPEYTQFRAFYDSLVALPDAQRYQTALAVAAAGKLSGNVIVNSMNARLAALQAEEDSFGRYLSNELELNVEQPTRSAERIDVKIQELAAEITKLTAESQKLVTDAGAARSKMEQNAAAFSAAVDAVRKNLVAERDITASHVTPAPKSNV